MTSTQGRVVDSETYTDSSPAPGTSMAGESKIDVDDRLVHYKTKMYRPTVVFEDSKGSTHTITTTFSSNKPKQVGDAVEVVYHPAEPEKAQLKEFYWFWARLLAIFGACILVIGLGALLLVVAL